MFSGYQPIDESDLQDIQCITENELTKKKLELEQRRLALDERRLKLDEEKLKIEIKEREQKLQMELREREQFLLMAKNQQNILEFFINNFTVLSNIKKV